MIDKDSILSKYKYYDDNTTHIMYFIFTSFFFILLVIFSVKFMVYKLKS